MLAALVRTAEGASSAGVLVSLVLAPLGGSWWPLFITPDWMQALGKLTPHGWANTAFNNLMLFHADFGDVVINMCGGCSVWRGLLDRGVHAIQAFGCIIGN